MLVAVLYLCVVLYVVQGDNDYNDTTCDSDYKYANNINKLINITELCTSKSPCITKCCPLNHILVLERAVYPDYDNLTCMESKYLTSLYNVTQLDEYSDVIFHENNVKQDIRESNVTLEDFIIIYKDDFFSEDCSVDVEDAYSEPHTVYILRNGTAVIRRLNFFNQWHVYLPPGQFCMDHQIVLESGDVSKPELVIRVLTEDDEGNDPFDKNTLTASGRIAATLACLISLTQAWYAFTYTSLDCVRRIAFVLIRFIASDRAMLVSCVFLLLVLAVYALLKQLHNLAGLMLMTYVSTLTVTFMLRAVQVLLTDNMIPPKSTCIWLGLAAHYTLVASFTWMNVMSFDIWWSMRGFRKMRQINRRGVLVKFGWYSLYGWGAPLLLTLFMIIVENLDLTHVPNFIKSNYLNEHQCFIETDEQVLCLDCPILITTCINIVLFLMTAYNIWRIKHAVSEHSAGNSRRNEKDETRFGIYLKLSLIMGISWILEVISVLYKTDSYWWYAPDVFNSLTGLFIFIIFICKRSIIVQLCKRLGMGHEIIRKWQPVETSCNDSTRSNSRNSKSSRRKMLDSVTETSDIYDHDRKYYFDHVQLKPSDKPS